MQLKEHIAMVSAQALEPEAHQRLGDAYAGLKQWHPAIAEYRTSITLGIKDARVRTSLAEAYLAGKKAIPLSRNCANRYQRIRRLADHITGLYAGSDFSVLDVGGGDGLLSLFIPDAGYALAEPEVNGISGTDIPFAEKSFDAVVACHVLEHVPKADRPVFLDQLCARAKKHILLLNPFFDPDADTWLELIADLTGAPWAKEHLACEMPKLEEVEEFAARSGLDIRIFPNGSKTTTLAYAFMEHYAALAGRGDDLPKINNLFNTLFYSKLADTGNPNDYLIEFAK